MGSFRDGFILGYFGTILNHNRKEKKKYNKMLEKATYITNEVERLSLETIKNTAFKKHFIVKARVTSKEIEHHEFGKNYIVRLNSIEPAYFGDYVIGKGIIELNSESDYSKCCQGDIVDVHYHLRFDKEGKPLGNVILDGEPPTKSLTNFSNYFLNSL